ncbi:MAG: SH3 domain-containing protein [Patescibacteria group bacterium]|jgi:uncharacterized protein YgiM (DUF1202 family)
MKKLLLFVSFLVTFMAVQTGSAKAATWKATTPEGYTPITWAGARGISTFMKAPEGNGHLDFLTVIYLPYNQIKFIASSTPKTDWGLGKPPFNPTVAASETTTEVQTDFVEVTSTPEIAASSPATSTAEIHDWAFAKLQVERAKAANKNAKFIWNVPFFNVEIPVTDLSMSLKSSDTSGTYVTSGSRPDSDIAQLRQMLIINNAAGTSTISSFDENLFINDGDQAVEGFDASITPKGSDSEVARLFIGVKPGGKELIIYCSKGASPSEAREALLAAGVPVENQLQADGGGSATCAYNLTGQYFVEPGRTLPHLMGAFPIVSRGSVTEKGLNVRNAPNTKGKVLKKLNYKEPVIVYESKNGWLRISENNEWVFAKYIKQITN